MSFLYGAGVWDLAGVLWLYSVHQQARRTRRRGEALETAIDETQAAYPTDLFPVGGASLDCRSAQFARGLVDRIRERAAELEVRGDHEALRRQPD